MRQANRTAILFLIPALAVITAILLFPVVQTLALSFGRDTTSMLRDYEFAGLANYRRLLDTPRFVTSVLNTLFFTVVTVPVELILGLGLALVLNRRLPAQGLVRMAILFPWALPTALNALMWRWMFNADYGLFNAALTGTGIVEPINWLGSIPLAMYSMMFVSIWKTSSFIALLLLAGLQAIPHDIYEAAEMDGVTAWSKLRYITLPLLQPAILVAVLLRTMDAMRAFELPFNLTDGGPLTSTETLSLYAYRAIFQYVDFNLGSAAIIVQFLIIMIIAGAYLITLRRDSYA
ncbi:MAG TPA: sugar ABC transporter permease [Longimicrobiales bacterium]|nr:sugar ABC transporter permease [Longimicrobiales bacterium]